MPDYDATGEIRFERFRENMDFVLAGTKFKKLDDIKLVFIPMLHATHYYLMCFNLATHEINIIDNMATEVDFYAKYQGWPEKMVPSI